MTTGGLIGALAEHFLKECSAEDFAKGWRDVQVSTSDGETHTVRLTNPGPAFAGQLFQRYAVTSDIRAILPAMLSGKYREPDFLNSIIPADLGRLCIISFGLLFGPDKLRQMLSESVVGL